MSAEWSNPSPREALSWKVADAAPDDAREIAAPALAEILDTRSILTPAERNAGVADASGPLFVRTVSGQVMLYADFA